MEIERLPWSAKKTDKKIVFSNSFDSEFLKTWKATEVKDKFFFLFLVFVIN